MEFMLLREMGVYRVGEFGWIDVLDGEGNRKWVEGEIVNLIPTPEEIVVYASIRTPMGTGLYRIW